MDGGTAWNLNIASAINGCLSLGYTEDKITLDVYEASSHGLDSYIEEN